MKSKLILKFGAMAAMAAALICPGTSTAADSTNAAAVSSTSQRYKIAVCDWMILKRQKLGAFQLTKDIGADGVEVDMGSLSTNETFDSVITRDAKVRQQFLDKAKELNLEISSIAMSGFYAQSFGNRPTVPRMTQDCIDTMKAMNVKIAFLPVCMLGDPISVLKNEEKDAAKGHPEKYMPQYNELVARITERLKALAVKAEAAHVIIGIETGLPAADELKLLKEINSPAIRSYFNFSNALQNGRDLNAELRTLGKEYICQIHCTDQDGVWLQNDPKIDMPKVKQTLDEMGWSGWLVMERSRDKNDSRNVKKNYGANAAYLKSIFQNNEK
jgi:sugar phosphate isomerase/epimerase